MKLTKYSKIIIYLRLYNPPHYNYNFYTYIIFQAACNMKNLKNWNIIYTLKYTYIYIYIYIHIYIYISEHKKN